MDVRSRSNDGEVSLPSTDSASSHPTLLKHFATPPKTQAGSLLLSTVPELRLKILRNLLRSDGDITHYQTVDTETRRTVSIRPRESTQSFDERFKRAQGARYEFSSQVMACCQQLYYEASAILYKENTASILWGEFHQIYAPAFAFELPFRSLPFGAYRTEADLATTEGQVRQHMIGCHSKFSIRNIYPALSEFERINITLKTRSHEQFFVMARLLRGLLRNKIVKVTILQCKMLGRPLQYDLLWLNSCCIWRCKDITFVSRNSSQVDHLKALIESKQPVYDTYEILEDCIDIYHRLSSFTNWSQCGSDVSEPYESIRHAVLTYASYDVGQLKREFLEAVERGVRNFEKSVDKVERQIKSDRRRFENTKTDIRDVLGMIANSA